MRRTANQLLVSTPWVFWHHHSRMLPADVRVLVYTNQMRGGLWTLHKWRWLLKICTLFLIAIFLNSKDTTYKKNIFLGFYIFISDLCETYFILITQEWKFVFPATDKRVSRFFHTGLFCSDTDSRVVDKSDRYAMCAVWKDNTKVSSAER
jgi:hypothetical protein